MVLIIQVKKIKKQIAWNEEYAQGVWTQIVCQKILNQANLLKKYKFDSYEKLSGYVREMEFFDSTNREGHAAKVYFNSLFGKGFSRDDMSSVNAALNYGYGILLSNFNKEIVADGYLTQLGIKHINEYNLTNAIQIYLDKIFDAIEHESFDTSILYEFA
jgi:CRISPR-associated protein Cas1